jgi:hypothetical protein
MKTTTACFNRLLTVTPRAGNPANAPSRTGALHNPGPTGESIRRSIGAVYRLIPWGDIFSGWVAPEKFASPVKNFALQTNRTNRLPFR